MAELVFQNKLLKSKVVAVRQHRTVLQDNRTSMQTRKLVDGRTAQLAPKPNNTGLPNNLKSGIESLSGMSMDNVKVHYNSSRPAQLNAHAYAQGTDIHVAPGQEKHLPHEAWHVVQQAQGRVRPTMQMKVGVPVNDDKGLEQEADAMGRKALSIKTFGKVIAAPSMEGGFVQRTIQFMMRRTTFMQVPVISKLKPGFGPAIGNPMHSSVFPWIDKLTNTPVSSWSAADQRDVDAWLAQLPGSIDTRQKELAMLGPRSSRDVVEGHEKRIRFEQAALNRFRGLERRRGNVGGRANNIKQPRNRGQNGGF